MEEYIIKVKNDEGPIEIKEIKPLVRCKDCKYFDPDGWCNSIMIDVDGPDWFCAGGKSTKPVKIPI